MCRFGVPHTIITDNGKQFDNANFQKFCSNLGIKVSYASSAHPQTNGQVEAINKIIKQLEKKKGRWAEDLPEVLWAYRTTHKTATGETPFALSFGTEAVVPVEVGMASPRALNYKAATNSAQISVCLDLLEELREKAQVRQAAYQHRVSRFFNSRVSPRSFAIGDWVLRKVLPNMKNPNEGVFGANWEGPLTRLPQEKLPSP